MVGNLPLKLKIKRMCDLKMSLLPKPYKKWNIFERRFFWLNNLGIAIMMFGSFVAVIIPTFNNSIKAEIVAFLMTSYAIERTYLWNKLEKLEAQKKQTAYPITKEEVAS